MIPVELYNEIQIDLRQMLVLTEEIEQLILSVSDKQPTNVQKTALGSFVSQFYNGVENILKRILKFNLITLPKGDDWHINLLKMYKNGIFGINLFLSEELFLEFNNLRKFRHYFYHGYSIHINWDILSDSAKNTRNTFNSFADFLNKL